MWSPTKIINHAKLRSHINSVCYIAIIQTLTFITFTVSKKIPTLKFLPHLVWLISQTPFQKIKLNHAEIRNAGIPGWRWKKIVTFNSSGVDAKATLLLLILISVPSKVRYYWTWYDWVKVTTPATSTKNYNSTEIITKQSFKDFTYWLSHKLMSDFLQWPLNTA